MSNQRLQSFKNRTTAWFNTRSENSSTIQHPEPESNLNGTINPITSSSKTRGYAVAFKPDTPPGLHIDLCGSYDSEDLHLSSSRKKQKGSVSTKRKAECMKYTKENFVDLTSPPSFDEIKKRFSLFYSYNPQGCDVPIHSDFPFCEHCRCPLVYCSDTVFGKACYDDVERLVCKMGFDEFDNYSKIKTFFRCTYSDMVKSKMLINKVSMKNVSEYRYMKLPRCIKKGSLRRLIEDVNLWKDDFEEKEMCCDELTDPPMTDEDKLFLAMETGIGLPHDLPPLDPPLSETVSAMKKRVVNPYNLTRSTVGQAPDVSPLFKSIKQEVENLRKK